MGKARRKQRLAVLALPLPERDRRLALGWGEETNDISG